MKKKNSYLKLIKCVIKLKVLIFMSVCFELVFKFIKYTSRLYIGIKIVNKLELIRGAATHKFCFNFIHLDRLKSRFQCLLVNCRG